MKNNELDFSPYYISDVLHDAWEQEERYDHLLKETLYEQTFMRKRDYEPTFEEIKKLRKEIVLGSYYYTDFENSFNFDEHEVSAFFDGYLDFLQTNYEDEHDGEYPDDVFDLESDEELEAWFYSWCDMTFTQYYVETIEIPDEDEEDEEDEEVA